MSARRRDREVFPHVEEAIGEDPARFLDREILVVDSTFRRLKTDGDGSSRYVPDADVADPLEFIATRIRGIDRLEVIARWQAVEQQLVRTPDGGRPKINELLQQRARELERDGGREEQLENRRDVVVDDQGDVEDDGPVWRHVAENCGSNAVEQVNDVAYHCLGCESRVPPNRVEVIEA